MIGDTGIVQIKEKRKILVGQEIAKADGESRERSRAMCRSRN